MQTAEQKSNSFQNVCDHILITLVKWCSLMLLDLVGVS